MTLLGLVVVTVLFLFFLNFLSLNLRGDLIGMLRLLKAVKGLLVFVAVLITPSGGRLGTWLVLGLSRELFLTAGLLGVCLATGPRQSGSSEPGLHWVNFSDKSLSSATLTGVSGPQSGCDESPEQTAVWFVTLGEPEFQFQFTNYTGQVHSKLILPFSGLSWQSSSSSVQWRERGEHDGSVESGGQSLMAATSCWHLGSGDPCEHSGFLAIQSVSSKQSVCPSLINESTGWQRGSPSHSVLSPSWLSGTGPGEQISELHFVSDCVIFLLFPSSAPHSPSVLPRPPVQLLEPRSAGVFSICGSALSHRDPSWQPSDGGDTEHDGSLGFLEQSDAIGLITWTNCWHLGSDWWPDPGEQMTPPATGDGTDKRGSLKGDLDSGTGSAVFGSRDNGDCNEASSSFSSPLSSSSPSMPLSLWSNIGSRWFSLTSTIFLGSKNVQVSRPGLRLQSKLSTLAIFSLPKNRVIADYLLWQFDSRRGNLNLIN